MRRVALALALFAATSAARPAPVEVTVFAAASLAGATADLARQYERAHPGVRVRLVTAGSQQLVAQLEQGASADVFASADARWMERLAAAHALAAPAEPLAHNLLALIVPRANRARIARVDDLARAGTQLVLGAPAVPVGAYARAMLARAVPDSGTRARVLANVRSEEESVSGVLAKVQLGEADAGVVYRSDVTAAVARHVRIVALPDSVQRPTTAFIAPLARATQASHAAAFVAWTRLPAGQRVLVTHGFRAAARP